MSIKYECRDERLSHLVSNFIYYNNSLTIICQLFNNYNNLPRPVIINILMVICFSNLNCAIIRELIFALLYSLLILPNKFRRYFIEVNGIGLCLFYARTCVSGGKRSSNYFLDISIVFKKLF